MFSGHILGHESRTGRHWMACPFRAGRGALSRFVFQDCIPIFVNKDTVSPCQLRYEGQSKDTAPLFLMQPLSNLGIVLKQLLIWLIDECVCSADKTRKQNHIAPKRAETAAVLSSEHTFYKWPHTDCCADLP